VVLWGRQEEGKRNGYSNGECSNEDVLLAAPTKPMFMFFLVSDYVAPHCATYTYTSNQHMLFASTLFNPFICGYRLLGINHFS